MSLDMSDIENAWPGAIIHQTQFPGNPPEHPFPPPSAPGLDAFNPDILSFGALSHMPKRNAHAVSKCSLSRHSVLTFGKSPRAQCRF